MEDSTAGNGSRSLEDSRKERILQAAEDEFAQKGFAAVRIDEIARLAESNKQLIYYYFGSKAGLYDAVLERMIEDRTSYWAELADADYETALGMLARLPSSDTWERLLSWEGSQFRHQGGVIRQAEVREQRYVTQADIFRKAQRSGALDPAIDPEMMSVLVASLNLSRATLPQIVKLATGLDPDSDEYVARERRFLLALIRALDPRGDDPSGEKNDVGGDDPV